MIIFFYLDDEGSVLTPSFVVITIDVNYNVAICCHPGSSKEGWCWSLTIRICFRVFATRSLFHPLFNQNQSSLDIFFSPAAVLDITAYAQVWVCQGGTVKVAQGGVHEYKRKVEKAFAATK